MIRAVLFDWGGTVMQSHPEYPGPMAYWPEVAAVPGVIDALEAIHGRYRLALATNAEDSGRGLTRQALARAGLDLFFDAIYSSHDLGIGKPATEFFAMVLADLALDPSEAIMVGDDYDLDVRGAKRAGLGAIWFNPTNAGRSHGPQVHDAEIDTMLELPRVLDGMN